MHIIGTAGHIDHGKSALVIALTGHDPDRWLEERVRGMTLDLGFAPLRFADGVEAGIVDVPGHERFLHNMLAGAAGMELLLLVIDAGEGPKPQTFEHLRILDFLNVRQAIIVLTKIDKVGPEQVERAAELAREATRGTVAEGAPIVRVSSVTGAGIDELKTAIHDALASLPPRDPDAPAYMPIDRVFALPGHGTIVTGTLMQGTIRAGDRLALEPSGHASRARSIQTFGRSVDATTGGARVAINLPGIGTDAIRRGETLVAPGQFTPSTDLRVEFTPLAAALPLLRRRTHVRAHIGSAEILGLLMFDSQAPRETQTVSARLVLDRPAVFYPGQRLVLRRMSPKDLLGGCRAVGLLGGAADFREAIGHVSAIVGRPGLKPLSAARVAAEANLTLAAVELELREALEAGTVVALARPLEYLSRVSFDDAWTRVSGAMHEELAAMPWRAGVTAADVARAAGADEPLALRLLDAWHGDGRLGQRGRFWHPTDHVVTLAKDQERFFSGALEPDPAQPLLPRSFAEISAAVAHSRVAGLADALESLLLSGALVRIGDDLYRRSQIERAAGIARELLSVSGSATMAQMRDAFGTSRKYALPLLEYFDSTGLTIRDGDLRRLRGAPARAAVS